MSVLLLQMCKAQVKSGGDGILSGAVCPVGKPERVKRGREFGDDVLLYQPLEALYHDGSRCDWPVVSERCDLRFFLSFFFH